MTIRAAYQRKYKHSAKGRLTQAKYYRSDAKRRANKRWRILNAHKIGAHKKLNSSIARGDIQRGICEVCGSLDVEGHHDDYARPLVVRWLCHKHHCALHHPKTRKAGEINEDNYRL